MYPLLQTSVELAEDEINSDEGDDSELAVPTEVLPEPSEIPSEETLSGETPSEVKKVITEKEMDDQFLHLCIRVSFKFVC